MSSKRSLSESNAQVAMFGEKHDAPQHNYLPYNIPEYEEAEKNALIDTITHIKHMFSTFLYTNKINKSTTLTKLFKTTDDVEFMDALDLSKKDFMLLIDATLIDLKQLEVFMYNFKKVFN